MVACSVKICVSVEIGFVSGSCCCFWGQDRVGAESGTSLREQCFLDDHQVGQREQGAQLRGVLGQAAVTVSFWPIRELAVQRELRRDQRAPAPSSAVRASLLRGP